MTSKLLQVFRTRGSNVLWPDAIEKEMKNIKVAFKVLPDRHHHMNCHMVFDLKINGFKQKVCLVAGGHMTDAPLVMIYMSVVSYDTVQIALTIAALNDLEVKASDIQNAYLTVPCEEKIWTTLGPKFGPEQGKMAVIVRALYGLKSAGGTFSRHISDCMRFLDYKPCKGDRDLWYKPMVRPDDGYKYYAYMLLYVDDALAIHHDATSALDELDRYFQMTPGLVGDPDIYLGAKLQKIQIENGVEAWSMSSSKYVQDAVKNAKSYL